MWKSLSGGVRITLPDQSDLQARVFVDWETFHSNFMAVAAGAGADADAARHRPHDAAAARCRRRASARTVQWSKARLDRGTCSRPAPTAAGSTAPATSRASTPSTGTTVTLLRDAGGTQHEQRRRSCRGSSGRRRACRSRSSGRVDHWRNYNARNLETTVATGPADGGQPACCRSATTRCSARARRRSITSPTRSPPGAASARASARRR